MKILKERSREYKGSSYFKFKVNIPASVIDRAKFSEGDQVQITAEPGAIILSKDFLENKGFRGIRSKLYKEAMKQFPNARLEEIEAMKKYLNPKPGERILEIGSGSGFSSNHISEIVGENGRVIVSDPSLEQLDDIVKLNKKNIDFIQFIEYDSEKIDLEDNKVDAVWSLGSLHHIFSKNKLFNYLSRFVKKDGRVVMLDVFSGSKLSNHFDDKVAKYCITGHEVAFSTREYIKTICLNNNFLEPIFYDLDIKFKFKNKEDIGVFLYKIHSMTKTTPDVVLKGAEDILGIEKNGDYYELNWPLTLFTTKKI